MTVLLSIKPKYVEGIINGSKNMSSENRYLSGITYLRLIFIQTTILKN